MVANIGSIAAVVVLFLGCQDNRGRPSASADATNQNKIAWQQALKAESEEAIRDARFVLSQVDLSQLTDPDLKEFIEYQRRFYTFCIQVGVPKDVNRDIQSILGKIDFKTLAQSLIEKGITKAHSEATRIADEGSALAAALDKQLDLKTLLARRYGLQES